MKKLTSILFALFLVSNCYSQIKKVAIRSDGIELNAYMYQAVGDELKPTIIWCHGNPGGKEEGKSEFAKRLNKHGINVLRFNYRGLWGTPGIFTPGNSQKDLKNILNFILQDDISLKYRIDTTRIVVAGYSHGSNVTIVSALHDDRINEIICLGLADYSLLNREFFNPDNIEMKKFNQEALEAIWGGEIYGQGKYASDFDKFVMDMLFNNYKYDFVAQADKLMGKRIYIIVGMNDVTGPIEKHFFPLYRELKKIGHENFDYEITESDHGFQELFDGTLSNMIAEWIQEK
jgi:alpha/beta superfamily hydrolase